MKKERIRNTNATVGTFLTVLSLNVQLYFKAREVEDVKKKVGIMRQLWIDEKLSLPVQITMKLLSKGNIMRITVL